MDRLSPPADAFTGRGSDVPNQLEDADLTWRGYMGDMGNDPRARAAPVPSSIGVGTDIPIVRKRLVRQCRSVTPMPPGTTRSCISTPSSILQRATEMSSSHNLTADLADAHTTPNFVFITPNLCDDGHDGSGTGAAGTTCANGQPGGLTSAMHFCRCGATDHGITGIQEGRPADHYFRRKQLLAERSASAPPDNKR